MFPSIDRVKPGLQKLIAALGETYPYASVLAVEDDARSWRVSRAGVSISASGIGGGTGFVVRVFDGAGCAEYSFNEFSEERIPDICDTLARRMAEQNAALEGFAPLPTPIPADEPAALKKETAWKVHPRELGDEAIVGKITALRERALAVDGRVLDATAAVTYRAYRKLFLSPNRDLDQTIMWTNAMVAVMASRGQEIKMSYHPFSLLGGAELLDQMDAGVEETARKALELLDSQPIPPGELRAQGLHPHDQHLLPGRGEHPRGDDRLREGRLPAGDALQRHGGPEKLGHPVHGYHRQGDQGRQADGKAVFSHRPHRIRARPAEIRVHDGESGGAVRQRALRQGL